MSDIQRIIEKVQKLRKLARSDNIHEAEAAAAAADRLIQEHGLAEAQLEAQGQQVAEPVAEDATPLAAWHRASTWQRILASGLIRHYDCATYLYWDYKNCNSVGNPALAQKVIGRASDIALVRYMWSWLSVEIERLAQLHKGNGRSWLDSFRRGAVNGVLNKLFENKQKVRDEAAAKAKVAEEILKVVNPAATAAQPAGSSALALYDKRKEDAKAKLYELHPDIKKQDERSRGGSHFRGASNYDGFSQGRAAGGNIHVGASLGSSGSAKALRGK
jgi:Protein of unknown function (DUF2786)